MLPIPDTDQSPVPITWFGCKVFDLMSATGYMIWKKGPQKNHLNLDKKEKNGTGARAPRITRETNKGDTF